MPLPFLTPCSIGVFGSSLSGKSTLVKKILEMKDKLFDRKVGQILYIYSVWSPLFQEMLDFHGDKIQFLKELPEENYLREWRAQSKDLAILILDDQLDKLSISSMTLATTLVHHMDMVFFMISQSLFFQNKHYRTLSLNLHYMLIARLRRDKSQIMVLARQVCPAQSKFFLDAYYQATEGNYNFFRIDVHPKSHSYLTLSSDFMSDYPVVYLDKDNLTTCEDPRVILVGSETSTTQV